MRSLVTSSVFYSYNKSNEIGYLQARGIDILFQQLRSSFSSSGHVSQPCSTFSYVLPMSFPVVYRRETKVKSPKLKGHGELRTRKVNKIYTLLCCLRSI